MITVLALVVFPQMTSLLSSDPPRSTNVFSFLQSPSFDFALFFLLHPTVHLHPRTFLDHLCGRGMLKLPVLVLTSLSQPPNTLSSSLHLVLPVAQHEQDLSEPLPATRGCPSRHGPDPAL